MRTDTAGKTTQVRMRVTERKEDKAIKEERDRDRETKETEKERRERDRMGL